MPPPAPPVLSLHDWSCLRTELLWIYDHAPNVGARHGIFDHRESNWAWYLRRGEVRVETTKGPLIARAGQWLFPPAEIHRHDFSDDAVLISVRFLCQWPSGENLVAAHPGFVLDGVAHPHLLKTARALNRLVRRHAPGSHYDHTRRPATSADFTRLQRAFLAWLDAWFHACLSAGAAPSHQAGDERVRRAVRVLDSTPLDRPAPRAAAARAAGLSAVQLSRLFQKQFQLTPLLYWERRRFEFARHALETSPLPIKELAARLGFRGHAHFTVWFKRRAGISPQHYRERETHA